MRKLAPIAYLAATLSFALTFFDVVHQGESLIHFTGQELVTGTTFHRPLLIGKATVEIGRVPALPAADVALGCLAVAAAIFWVKGREAEVATAALGLAAAVSFVFLRWEVAAVIAGRFPGTVIRYAGAYWCSMFMAWLGVALAAAVLLRRRQRERAG